MQEPRFPRVWKLRALEGVLFFYFACSLTGRAQTNSWIGPISANWEAPEWSLGILPAVGQDILFTNAGWKAVEIGSSTTHNYAQTLNIESLTIASPTDAGANTLLMNYAGFETALMIGSTNEGSLVIADTNSTIIVLSSALVVRNSATNGPFGEMTGAFSVDGTFDEDVGSQVTAGFLEVGDFGPGTFNLTNSFLSVSNFEIIYSEGALNQYGGTNITSAVVLEGMGQYNLYDGYFTNQIDFDGGAFNQLGGTVSANVVFIGNGGTYDLAGGLFAPGDFTFPALQFPGAFAFFTQSGGTNACGNLTIGNNAEARGSYEISEGYLTCSNLTINTSFFLQSGGIQVSSNINVFGMIEGPYDDPVFGTFEFEGGSVTSGNLAVGIGFFGQSGGVAQFNSISCSIFANCGLSGGLLISQSISMSDNRPDFPSFFSQSGGTNQTDSLSISGFSTFTLTGGQLSVQNMNIGFHSVFQHSNGVMNITGMLTLEGGTWQEQGNGQQFGQVQLGGTNFLMLPSSNACVMQFANSSSLGWSDFTTLMIQNWNGSLSGGGMHQIAFGTGYGGLTFQQLNDIQFSNPAGLPAGTYPARILSNGEIVPYVPINLLLFHSPNSVQLTFQGEAAATYEVQFSSNLVNWIPLTNEVGSNGRIVVSDPFQTNVRQRFYRAILLP